MKEILTKKENNLFQSEGWLSFQKKSGRKVIPFTDFSGIAENLPFGKSFLWIQRGPKNLNLQELREEGKKAGAVFVRIEPAKVTEKEKREGFLKLVMPGSLLSGQASPKATRVLDISKPEEEILAGMKQKTRYNIRLAGKKGVTVKESEDVGVLYSLLQATAKRDRGYAPHEKDYYEKMVAELAGDKTVRIFTAEKDGEPLAAILVSVYGEVATYLHGGFSDKYRNLMAPYLCQWEAIKYAKERGCSCYDFWGVAETDDPADPWAGISRFKEGFGGEKVIFPGSYDIIISSFWYNLFTLAAKLKHIVKRHK